MEKTDRRVIEFTTMQLADAIRNRCPGMREFIAAHHASVLMTAALIGREDKTRAASELLVKFTTRAA